MRELIRTYKALRDDGPQASDAISCSWEMSRLRTWLPRRMFLLIGRGGKQFQLDDMPMRIEWFGRIIWTDKRWPVEGENGKPLF